MSVALSIAPVEDQLAVLGLNEFALLAPAIGAMLLTVRFVDHRPLRAFGIGLLPRWRRDLFFGLGIAAGMLAFLIAGCYFLGFVSIRGPPDKSATTLLATFGLLGGSSNEELVFALSLTTPGRGNRRVARYDCHVDIVRRTHRNNPNVGSKHVQHDRRWYLLSLAYADTLVVAAVCDPWVGMSVWVCFRFSFIRH
jgi:hypothetical protein